MISSTKDDVNNGPKTHSDTLLTIYGIIQTLERITQPLEEIG